MVKYTLSEYSYLSGCGHCVHSSTSLERLHWEDCDALNTYDVQRDHTVVAEFEGCDVWSVRAWLLDNPGYDGREGSKAWKGECDCCGRNFSEDRNGHCDCIDSVRRYNDAVAREAVEEAFRANFAKDSARFV